MSFLAIYITHSDEQAAKKIADALLQQKLIACANIFPITSAYWWQGNLEHEGEWVSIVKTTPQKWDELVRLVEQIHPYEVPCIMKFEVAANAAYEKWIYENVAL